MVAAPFIPFVSNEKNAWLLAIALFVCSPILALSYAVPFWAVSWVLARVFVGLLWLLAQVVRTLFGTAGRAWRGEI